MGSNRVVLGIAVLFLCASLGSSYAALQDYMTVGDHVLQDNGPHVGVRALGVCDPGADSQYGTASNTEGKDVAITTIANGSFVANVETPDGVYPFYDSISFSVGNAYPWYASGVCVEFVNLDPNPGYIVDVSLASVSGQSSIMDFMAVHDWEISYNGLLVAAGGTESGLYDALSEVVVEQYDRLQVCVMFHFVQEVYDPVVEEYVVLPQGASMSFVYHVAWEQTPVETVATLQSVLS